jgi:hypothetical protein
VSETQLDRISRLETQLNQMQVRLSELEFKVGADMALECRYAPGWNTDEFVQDEHTPIKPKQTDTPAQKRNLITDTNFKSIT